MNDLISISQLREEATLEEWKSFCSAQLITIEECTKKIKELQKKNYSLEVMLMSKFNESMIAKLTPEEEICIIQIERLQKLSNERALVLDEVKRLDLLVKNLKLIREESTIILNKNSDTLKEEDLVAIIRSSDSAYKPE